uniref:Uncharacterized protein n=1 Tax=Arundo donax TaxID=35708 RepID=A0A0A8Z4W4_ARUDO
MFMLKIFCYIKKYSTFHAISYLELS